MAPRVQIDDALDLRLEEHGPFPPQGTAPHENAPQRPEFYRRDSCFEATARRRESNLTQVSHKIHRSRLSEEDEKNGKAFTNHVVDCRHNPPPFTSSTQDAIRIMATTFNVGNRRVNDTEMDKWLGTCEDCDIVVIALQEANYLSSSQKRGLAMLAGVTVLGAAGPLGIGAGLVVGASTAGAMALHSHVMPKIRRAIKRRNGRPRPNRRPGAATSDDDEDDDTSEDEEDSFTKKGAEGTPMLSSAIASAIDRQLVPRGLERAVLVAHGQMRLVVYVRTESCEVDVLSRAKHGMGLAMNKGGLMARVLLRKPCAGKTSLAFIGAHLPAHEGKRRERTEALDEICRAFDKETDAADAVFLLGDLNYRLSQLHDLPVDFETAVNLIHTNRLDQLHAYDELVRELEGLDPAPPLRAFATPSCDFAPTFKVIRRSDTYNDKRCPAWCDRVLFRTRPSFELKILHYDRCTPVLTSDHKPVVLKAQLRRIRNHSSTADKYKPPSLNRRGSVPASKMRSSISQGDSRLSEPAFPTNDMHTSSADNYDHHGVDTRHSYTVQQHNNARICTMQQSNDDAAAALLADSPH